MDLLSTWMQTLTVYELKVFINNAWCMYGKLTILCYLMILFEDRQPLILSYFAVSCVTTFIQSCVMSRLVREYKTELTVLDWFKVYVTMALDVKFHCESVYQYFTRSKREA